MRAIGIFFLLLGAAAAAGEIMHLDLPTVRWLFETSRQAPWLHLDNGAAQGLPWFGWASVLVLVGGGLAMIIHSATSGPRNPLTTQRLRRFREIKRMDDARSGE